MFKKIMTLIAIAVTSPVVSATEDFTLLTKFIEQTKKVSGLESGTAVAIVKDGKVVYQNNFGYSDIANKKLVTKDTYFYVASTTKPFYSMSTLIDINNKQLKADDTLATLFPKGSFKMLPDEIANQVTVKDLLVHGSGIENETLGWAVAYTGLHDLEARKRMLFETTKPLEKVKYGEFDYTNFGYNLLSVWYDENHQISWQESIQKNVYTPLGMKHTTSIMSKARSSGWDIARPYSFVNNDKNEALYLEKVDKTMHSAGGMVTSATDMAQMVIAQLDQGKINGKQVLPANIIKQSQEQQIKTKGNFDEFVRDGYAWGWYTGDYKGQRMLHHLGGFAGTHALISFMPEKNIGVVILNNEGYLSRRMTGVATSIAYGILLGETNIELEAKKGLDKIEGVVEKFPKMKAAHIKKLNSRPWKLSKPKVDYVGIYKHPLLGKIKIELDDKGAFHYSWGQLKSIAQAFTKQDTMRVELIMFSGYPVQFQFTDNKVSSLIFDGNTFEKLN
jgi:CubicO group peptidase (beta-lactamase class C family)